MEEELIFMERECEPNYLMFNPEWIIGNELKIPLEKIFENNRINGYNMLNELNNTILLFPENIMNILNPPDKPFQNEMNYKIRDRLYESMSNRLINSDFENLINDYLTLYDDINYTSKFHRNFRKYLKQ